MRRLLLAAALSAAAVAGTAAAQIPEVPAGKWWKRPRVVEMLKLSPEQQDRLEGIFSKNRRSFVDLKVDVERHQIDVDELVTKKDSDPKKVSQAIDALEQARLRLRKAWTTMALEQKDVLTATQWRMILDRREEWRRERMDERRGGPRREMGPQGRSRPEGAPPALQPREEKLEQ